MKHVRSSILQCIGDTPLLELRHVVPENGARVLLKLESANPTGSMKDRMALAMVEPAESPVLSGSKPGSHKIDGIGAGFVVPLWRAGLADQIERVSTEDAVNMALRLARDEGVFAGTSTGANVIAALRAAEQLGAGATVVTVMCDTGMKYLKSYGAALDRLARPA